MPTFNILSQSQNKEMEKSAQSGWGMGSQDNSEFIQKMCRFAESKEAKRTFESYFSNPCRAIIVKPNQVTSEVQPHLSIQQRGGKEKRVRKELTMNFCLH
ncbi:unnamed protein product [Cuscuta epithymum]|uniref:Uncharacterized protein n=1 Tax=Cuscuta epithymum TaxID=186058 RepID=A0AAV0E3H7_9ASTE|nr:unnamed protein product [Cuscuta epithymum]